MSERKIIAAVDVLSFWSRQAGAELAEQHPAKSSLGFDMLRRPERTCPG